MRCPYCANRDSRVTDSRANDDGIRRRRECIACGERFTTTEMVQLSSLLVVKRDGRREEFNREKLLAGLRKACSKRNVSTQQIEILAADIEARLLGEGKPEVPATQIGELAMEGLRGLDHIAYIRFASVYRPFADLDSLKEAITALEAPDAEDTSASVQLVLPGTDDKTPRGPRLVIEPRRPVLVGVPS